MPPRWLRTVIVSLLISSSGAFAQNWPQRPIHVIVPFAAGSIVDLVPRLLFERVSAELDQPIVIENRPGAGSTIGAAAVAEAKSDGYTLLVNSSAQTIAPLLYSHLPYDASHDFSPVAPLASITDVLVISPSKRVQTVQDLVEKARAEKGTITFASLGVGSGIYLNAQRFLFSAKATATQVPFKGAPAAIKEVISGDVDFCFCAIGTTLPYIKSGQLLALAVSSPTRSALLPEVPATSENFSNSDYMPWIGVFAPAKTPPSIVGRLHDAIEIVLQSPEIVPKLRALGLDPLNMSVAKFEAYIRRDTAINRTLVAKIGLKPH